MGPSTRGTPWESPRTSRLSSLLFSSKVKTNKFHEEEWKSPCLRPYCSRVLIWQVTKITTVLFLLITLQTCYGNISLSCGCLRVALTSIYENLQIFNYSFIEFWGLKSSWAANIWAANEFQITACFCVHSLQNCNVDLAHYFAVLFHPCVPISAHFVHSLAAAPTLMI